MGLETGCFAVRTPRRPRRGREVLMSACLLQRRGRPDKKEA
jgi:hypothetical protein